MIRINPRGWPRTSRLVPPLADRAWKGMILEARVVWERDFWLFSDITANSFLRISSLWLEGKNNKRPINGPGLARFHVADTEMFDDGRPSPKSSRPESVYCTITLANYRLESILSLASTLFPLLIESTPFSNPFRPFTQLWNNVQSWILSSFFFVRKLRQFLSFLRKGVHLDTNEE